MSLYDYVLWCLLQKYLGVEWLGHRVGDHMEVMLCLTCCKTAKLFSKVVTLFHILISNVWEVQLLHIFSIHLISVFIILEILVSVHSFKFLPLDLSSILSWFWYTHEISIKFHFVCVWVPIWRRQWHPTPVFLPGKSQGWGSLMGCHLWGCTELDTTEAT